MPLLRRRMNRTLDLGSVWNRAAAGVFKQVSSQCLQTSSHFSSCQLVVLVFLSLQLDMAQLVNGGVFMADDVAFEGGCDVRRSVWVWGR